MPSSAPRSWDCSATSRCSRAASAAAAREVAATRATGELLERIEDLGDLLEPLTNEFRVQAADGVAFRWQKTAVWAESDPKYLRRILQNFLSNAVRYTRHGKIVLGCRRRGDRRRGRRVPGGLRLGPRPRV